jgi:deoxyribodipyrimidine photolyase-related protein
MYHRFWYYHESIYDTNVLDHTIPLPYRFWDPDHAPEPIQQMACVSHVLHKVKKYGYSHHIERLMVIGNVCLLIGYDPHDVNKWFWEQYIDAFERVVTPNVL